VWGFVLTLFFFKLIVVGIIFWNMQTFESGVILISTLWYYFPPIILLGAGPAIFYFRLRKARARRAELQRAEWMLGEQDVSTAAEQRR
jgi:hypothetical protein